jgi:hypothetical protein
MKKILLFLFLISLNNTNAQSIFKDDLSSYISYMPLNSQGSWNNSSATGGGGLGGPCNTCTAANVIPQTMSYLNYGSTTKALQINSSKDGIGRPIFPVITNGDLYVGMVINLTNSAANANDFVRVVNGTNAITTFRMYAQLGTNGGYKIGIKKGAVDNATVFATDELQYNQDNLIILKYSHLPGASDDIVSVYINPEYALGEPINPSAIANSGIDQSENIDRVAFRLNQTLAMPSGAASLVSVAKSWSSLGFMTLGIEELDIQNLFKIVSSEAKNGILKIKSMANINDAKINIYSLTGALVESKLVSINNGDTSININPLHKLAIYLLEITGKTGERFIEKITID